MQVQFLPGSDRLNDFLTVTTVSAITWPLGTGQMSAEHRPDRAAPGSYQLNRSSEPRTRTCPAAGHHLQLLCMLFPTLAGRYCCASPEASQGLHFSGGVSSTCMSAPWCAQEHGSNKRGVIVQTRCCSTCLLGTAQAHPACFPAWGLHLHGTCIDGAVAASSIPFLQHQQPGPKSLPSMLKLIWPPLMTEILSVSGEAAHHLFLLLQSLHFTPCWRREDWKWVEVSSFAFSSRRHWTCLSVRTFSAKCEKHHCFLLQLDFVQKLW